MNRTNIVMKALDVKKEDALKIIDHLTKQDCLEWIDDFDEECREGEQLVDVHYEDSFEDMIDWQFEDAKPSEMFGLSANIEDYPEMLQLKDKVIFWYALVL